MLALSALPTFGQESSAGATPLPTPPPAAQASPAPVAQPSPTPEAAQAKTVLAATATNDPSGSNISQVLKLVKSGVGDEVILAYVKNSRSYYNLGAEDVLKLKDAGASSPVITAMLSHDNALRAQTGQKRSELATAPAPAPAPAATPVPSTPAPSATAAPAPAPTVTVMAAPQPPPPQVEVVPIAPGPDYYWSDGYWSWRGGAWVWVGGSWTLHPGVRVYIGGGPRYHWRHW